jgi:hypothetical protein
MKLGLQIEKLIGQSGSPWGCSTTAIIAAFGVRLLHQSFHISKLNISLHDEMTTCFKFCDDDDKIFKKVLNEKDENIHKNDIVLKLFSLIINVLQMVRQYENDICSSVISDYELGIIYCNSALKGCFIIMKANDFIGISHANKMMIKEHMISLS